MTEIERNKRIFEEYERISVFFESLGENEKTMVDPLIRNAAFMRVALDDLQEIIAEQGPVEAYQNGANQFGMKQSAALQSYNATMKVYSAIIRDLFRYLPPMKKPTSIPAFEPQIKTEDRRQREEKGRAELDAAIAFQAWQRAEEAAGRKPTMSFNSWRMENNR